MQRRKFLSLSALTGLAVVAPLSLEAVDFRQTKADAWTAHTVDDAVKSLYGGQTPVQTGVTVTTQDLATNSASVSVNIKSDIDAKSVAIFQDANPESAVAAFTVHKSSIIDYDFNIKLRSNGTPITITAIVEGVDGKFYSGTKTLKVALGTCDG